MPRIEDDTLGLIAILNNRLDFARVREQHWYRVPVNKAPRGLLEIRWIGFFLTQAFDQEKWSVRYWAQVKGMRRVQRAELLPSEPDHPRAQVLYYRLELGPLHQRAEPIFSRRRRRIVFIPTTWRKFRTALEINDLDHGSPLEDRLWGAFRQEGIDAERQWFVDTTQQEYCLDFALFCHERSVDVETDGDTWHSNPERAADDNRRDNALQQLGWHVLRFNTRQVTDDLPYCLQTVRNTVDRFGGLPRLDGSVYQPGTALSCDERQLKLF